MIAPVWPDRPRMLLSFAYAHAMKDRDLEHVRRHDLIFDSGAFTAFTLGREINHADYLAFLREHAAMTRFAFSLDVIGDGDASWANFQRERDQLGDTVRIVPTYHLGSPWSMLERLCLATDYVAIGGAVPHYRNQRMIMRHAIRAHRIAADHGVRLHGLGVTGYDVVTKLPWASVDSSSWKMPRRRPFVYLARRDGKLRSFRYGERIKAEDVPTIRAYGGDPDALATYGWTSSTRVGKDLARERARWGAVASARSYMHLEAVLNTRAVRRGFRIYFAADYVDTEIVEAHELGDPWVPRKGTG